MAYELILYETKGGVARITLNRPKALNALNPQTLAELTDALKTAGEDDEVGVIVLTGAGRAFSAGVDLKFIRERQMEKGAVGSGLDEPAAQLLETLGSIPKVVIAAINGFCFTGALELALGCDLIVASSEAKFGDTHTKFGLRPSWGMSARLPRRVGLLQAKELSFTARTFDAAEAEKLGLINRCVPKDQFEGAVDALAKEILANSRDSIAAYKKLYNEGYAGTLGDALELERHSKFEIRDTQERVAGFSKK